MTSGINALGQGNRANATIGRALNLIVRNVGGGRPGELSRATLGGPHKYTFCFAEDESDPEWQPLATARGLLRATNAITFFQGDGIQAFVDQRSRTAPELTRSLAMALLACANSPTPCSSCRLNTTASFEMPVGTESESKASCTKHWSVPAKTLCKGPRASARALIRAEPTKWSTSFGRKVF